MSHNVADLARFLGRNWCIHINYRRQEIATNLHWFAINIYRRLKFGNDGFESLGQGELPLYAPAGSVNNFFLKLLLSQQRPLASRIKRHVGKFSEARRCHWSLSSTNRRGTVRRIKI